MGKQTASQMPTENVEWMFTTTGVTGQAESRSTRKARSIARTIAQLREIPSADRSRRLAVNVHLCSVVTSFRFSNADVAIRNLQCFRRALYADKENLAPLVTKSASTAVPLGRAGNAMRASVVETSITVVEALVSPTDRAVASARWLRRDAAASALAPEPPGADASQNQLMWTSLQPCSESAAQLQQHLGTPAEAIAINLEVWSATRDGTPVTFTSYCANACQAVSILGRLGTPAAGVIMIDSAAGALSQNEDKLPLDCTAELMFHPSQLERAIERAERALQEGGLYQSSTEQMDLDFLQSFRLQTSASKVSPAPDESTRSTACLSDHLHFLEQWHSLQSQQVSAL